MYHYKRGGAAMFGNRNSIQARIERVKKRYDAGKRSFTENAPQRWARRLMGYTLSPLVSGLITGTLLGQGLIHQSTLLVALAIALAVFTLMGLLAKLRHDTHPSEVRFAQLVDRLALLQNRSVNQVLEDLA